MRRFCALIVCALLATHQASAHGDLTVNDVDRVVAAEGPQAALNRFFDCSKYEGTGYEAVAQGSQEWVSLANRLLPYADACYSEGLADALGRAMRRSPSAVLPLVGTTALLSAERICLPFVSAELPPEDQREEIRKSRRAVEAAAGLESQRGACLAVFSSAEARLPKRQ